MKSIGRSLLFALLITGLMLLPVAAVRAESADELVPNPAAEAYLLEALRSDGLADLESFPEAERTVSGAALVNALKDPQVQGKSFLFIANLTVVDEVAGNDIILPGNIQFYKVKFAKDVDFNSSLLHAVWIGNSDFSGSLDLSFATLDGNVIIYGNSLDSLLLTQAVIDGSLDLREDTVRLGIDFSGAHITGGLWLDETQILGTEPTPWASYPAQFWATTVDGPASFLGTHFFGEAYFSQSEFYRLDMSQAVFDRDVYFKGIDIERSANFTDARFARLANFDDFYVGNTATFKGASFGGKATFENGTVVRDISFENAVFNELANFDYLTVGRFCDFIGTTFQAKFSFYYTTVAWPYFEGATFNGPVVFEGMKASEDFEVANSSYNHREEPFPVTLVSVGGAVKFVDFSAPAGLLLTRDQFGSLSITAEDKLKTEFIDLSGTEIENELAITNTDTKRFVAEGINVGKSTNLCGVSITEKLDIRNARIGFLKIDKQPQWPTDPDDFNLRGMTYTDIDIGDQGLTDETFQSLVGLVDQSAYSPQAYEALSQFLTDKGHPEWAAEVELHQNRRERREVLTPFSGAWLWSWFLDIFVGYGYRPALAFIWSGLVIAMGALVFRRREDMLPVEQDDAQVEYNPIWYSFALFLPYIDLGIACKWEPNPNRKWARSYKYIHMLLGWILAPIALLTFGGIIG